MAHDCRLTTADHIDVTLDGATITVSLHGIQLNPDEVARIVVLAEGRETRCRLEACTVLDSRGAETRDYEESFALAMPPNTVIIEHARGGATFEFELRAAPQAQSATTRGEPVWDDVLTEPSAEMPEDVQGPVIYPPSPPASVDVGGNVAPGDVVGDYANGGGYADGNIQPEADYGGGGMGYGGDASAPATRPQIGPVNPAPASPRPGGWFKGWTRWRKVNSEQSAPQAMPPDQPKPSPAPPTADIGRDEPPAGTPPEGPGRTAAMEPDRGPTAAMEPEDRGPTAANEPPDRGPTAAMGPDEPLPPPPPIMAGNGDGPDKASPAKGLFPRLDAPEFLAVGTPADIVVGIRPDEDAAIGGGPMILPPDTRDKFFLSVQVIADGFELGGNTTSWVHDLAVTPQQPFPFVEMTIVAKPIDVPAKAAIINVIYTVADQVIGKAKRAVAIGTQLAEAKKVDLPDVAVRRAMALPIGPTAADLTVVILADETGPGDRLLWAFRTPHEVDVPQQDCVKEIGDRPEAFAEALRRNAERAEGKPTMLKTMRGIGRTIAGAIHEDFWKVFDGVRKVKPNPTVLFLSEEPYVPWELAVLPASIDPANDKFLAAEAVTGRWLLIEGPQMPPPEHLIMKSMAVVFGEYADSKLTDLKEAKAEMESLKSTFQASPVRATQAALNELLDGKPSAEVLHFAIHGKFGDEGADLLMEDGSSLGPFTIEGSNLTSAPLVFLNACQVGAGNELLGEFAGMAQAFLSAGASAVIAPLWSVRDDIAREISLRFYKLAFAGEPPAEVLRRERASFSATDPPVSSTFLAYQFYGHPAFRLTK